MTLRRWEDVYDHGEMGGVYDLGEISGMYDLEEMGGCVLTWRCV